MALTTHAIIHAGVVENIAVVDLMTEDGQAWMAAVVKEHDAVVPLGAIDPQPGIGWTHIGDDEFVAPEPVVVSEVKP